MGCCLCDCVSIRARLNCIDWGALTALLGASAAGARIILAMGTCECLVLLYVHSALAGGGDDSLLLLPSHSKQSIAGVFGE